MKYYSILLSLMLSLSTFAQNNPLPTLIAEQGSELLQQVVADPGQYQLQVIYTQIDRDADNQPTFTSYTLGVDSNLYFYPASTVKLPTALLALERLNDLNIVGLGKYNAMHNWAARPPQTDAQSDTSSTSGMPSVAHYIKKIALVSDNDAYNRLYEWLGQQPLNHRLHKMGFGQSRIIHRLSVSGYDTTGNRFTNPVSFYGPQGLLHYQGEAYSAFYPDLDLRQQVRGQAYMNSAGEIVSGPFDFRYKNFISLQNLHDILQSMMFPLAVPAHRRFRLTGEDYQFLWRHFSMLPRESTSPAYPQYHDWDSYVKFLLFGDSREPIPDHIQIFNKVGDAYGFLTDVAYVIDTKNNIEFLLAANIHVNANATYNDGVYEYDEIGLPVLGELGRLVYEYELQRERKYVPDLRAFRK